MQDIKDNKETKTVGIQIGISSLLLIFTVVCIVIFCTLSFSSAKADHALAEKALKAAKAYYEADAQGEKIKKEVNEAILSLSDRSQEDFKRKMKVKFGEKYNGNDNVLIFVINTAYDQSLNIKLRPVNVAEITSGKQNFKVEEWRIVNNESYEIDTNMPLWTGE